MSEPIHPTDEFTGVNRYGPDLIPRLNKVAAEASWLQTWKRALLHLLEDERKAAASELVDVIIASSVAKPGAPNQWKYAAKSATWNEATKNYDAGALMEGQDFYNKEEMDNTDTVVANGTLLADPAGTYTIFPISVGQRVTARKKSANSWEFERGNRLDFTCAPP